MKAKIIANSLRLLCYAQGMEDIMLSKQEAAERQLVQAVKLQFSDGDPYAIHLLLMSSMRICRDVLRSKGVSDELERFIKPECRKEFFSIFYSIASFFKHADRDPAFLERPPDLEKGNEVYIILVESLVCDAFGVKNRNIFVHVAKAYYMRLYPDLVLIEDETKDIYNQPFSAFGTNQLCSMIRTLVKEGPFFLGTQSWTNDWTW